MPLQCQPAAWRHQHEHQQESRRTNSKLSVQQAEPQLGQQEHELAPPSPAGPAGSQQQQAGATQLHQLPSAALAAIASHLSSADRLALGRLVFGDSHAAAAVAVLGTLHSCSVRTPHGDSRSSCGQQQSPWWHGHVSCIAAVASMPHLRRLQLELQLPQQQTCAWAAAVEGLAGMCQLTSLQQQLSLTTQQQQQQLAQQQLTTLLTAVGSLQRCQELSIRLGHRSVQPESAVAARTTEPPALLLEPATLQPLVHLSSCLQSLQVISQQQMPAAALAHVACLSRLTALHLECGSSSVDAASSLSSMCSYEEAAVVAMLPVIPQLRQLALIGYFRQPQQQQQQQQQQTLLPHQGSSSSSLMTLLQHLQPSALTALDLGHNSQACLPFPAAAHALASLTSLRSLGLAGTAVRAADLAVVGQGLRCLTLLNLSRTSRGIFEDWCGIAVLPLRHWLGHFGCLQELLLCGRALTAADVDDVLQQLPRLTALDLRGALVRTSNLAQGMCRAQHARVSTQLGVDGVGGSTSRCRSGAQLKKLSLADIWLGPNGLEQLTAAAAAPAGVTGSSILGQLQEVDLRGCRTGGVAVAALRRALPGLQVVRLDGMDLAEQGLEWLISDY